MKFSGSDANLAVIQFWGAHSATLPDHIRDALAPEIANGGLAQLTAVMEGLYATKDTLNAEGLELLEGLTDLFSRNNFMGKGIRAASMVGTVMRMRGGGKKSDPQDLAPLGTFRKPTVVLNAPEPTNG